jgi:hypothetical protein
MRKLSTFFFVLIFLCKQFSCNDKVIEGQESRIQDFAKDEPSNYEPPKDEPYFHDDYDYPYDHDYEYVDSCANVDYLCDDICISQNSACVALVLRVSKIKMAMEIVSMETFFRDPNHVMEVAVYRISNVEIFAFQEQIIVIVDRTLKFLQLILTTMIPDVG